MLCDPGREQKRNETKAQVQKRGELMSSQAGRPGETDIPITDPWDERYIYLDLMDFLWDQCR